MEIFGIGILEVLAVFLLMAIVFGPHRLPEIARQFGRAVRELREYARDFRDEYLTDFEEVREEYLEVRYDLEQTDTQFREEMKELDQELRTTVREAERDATEAVQEAEKAATDTDTARLVKDRATADLTAPVGSVTKGAGATAEQAKGGARRTRRGRTRGQPSRGERAARPGKVISINRRRPRPS